MNLDHIQGVVDRIEKTGALGTGDRLIALLRYLVREELDGRGPSVKSFNIAVDVFGRADDFDPQSNSIVRVEIGRLRRALELYFATEGRNDPVAIVIPKGSYRPIFSVRDGAVENPAGPSIDPKGPALRRFERWLPWAISASILAGAMVFAYFWMANGRTPSAQTDAIASNSIVVYPVENRSGDRQLDTIALGLTTEIQKKLGNIKTLNVMLPGSSPTARETSSAQHALESSILKLEGRASLRLTLSNAQNRTLLWSENYALPSTASNDALKQTASQTVYDLRGRIFASTRRLIEEKGSERASPIELFLLATWFPGFAESSLKWENERIELAQRALRTDPIFGPAHSVLAEKMAYLANVDPASDTAERWAQARAHVRDALQYATDDPDAVFNIALHYWHAGELDQSTRALARVLELQSGHPLANFMARAVPYTCMSPPSDVLDTLIKLNGSLDSGNPVRWVTLGWLARLHFNKGEFSKALEYGLSANRVFTSPDAVVLAAAASLHLGKAEDARQLLDDQRHFWPSLSVTHYTGTTMARRCASSAQKDQVMKAYEVLRSAGLP